MFRPDGMVAVAGFVKGIRQALNILLDIRDKLLQLGSKLVWRLVGLTIYARFFRPVYQAEVIKDHLLARRQLPDVHQPFDITSNRL